MKNVKDFKKIVIKPNAQNFYNFDENHSELDIFNEEVPIVGDLIRVYITDGSIYLEIDGEKEFYAEDSKSNRKKAYKNAENIYNERKKDAYDDNSFDCYAEDLDDFVEYCTKN